MEGKLLRLIFDYSINNRLVDSEYLDKFIEIVVNNKELNEYVHNSIISTELIENPEMIQTAAYTPFTKTITIYENGINLMLEKLKSREYMFTDIEKVFYRNVVISQNILHELEHANQEKIKEEENSLESLILRNSTMSTLESDYDKILNSNKIDYLIYILRLREQNYRDNYLCAPFERLAEIKSFEEIINLLKNIEEYVPILLRYQKYLLEKNMFRGFKDDYFSPTIYYIEENQGDYSFMDWYNPDDMEKSLYTCSQEYDLHKRLRYGLMIDNREYENIKDYLSYTIFN